MFRRLEIKVRRGRVSPRSPGGREGRSPRTGVWGRLDAVERSRRCGIGGVWGGSPMSAGTTVKQGIALPFALVGDRVLSGSRCMIRFKFPCSGKGLGCCYLVLALSDLAVGCRRHSAVIPKSPCGRESAVIPNLRSCFISVGKFVVWSKGSCSYGENRAAQGLVVALVLPQYE